QLELKHLVAGTVPPSPAGQNSSDSARTSNSTAIPVNDHDGQDADAQHGEDDADADRTNYDDTEGDNAAFTIEDKHFTQGIRHAQLGDYDLAIAAFSRTLKIDPSDAEAWRCRAEAYSCLKQYERAVDDCTKAIVLDPNNKPCRICRATARLWLRRYEEALDD